MNHREGYDAVAVRARGKGGKGVERSKGGGGGTRPSVSSAAVKPHVAVPSVANSSSSRPSSSSSRPTFSSSTSRTTAAASSRKDKENIANASTSFAMSPKPTLDNHALIKSIQEQAQSLKSIHKLCLDVANSERDFYWNKLRGIELLCQVYKEKEEGGAEGVELGGEAMTMIEKAFRVMHAEECDNIPVDEDGNVSGYFCLFFNNDASCMVNCASNINCYFIL
ncbi:hypothetical protein ACHAWO_009329 [Cyclotella atomus]|uniref:EB1 C-terminal domain-containing protein n=1 Tax=Cyclotella atomus TaxID=382360 RepID=A0ABD3P3H8_9STRA